MESRCPIWIEEIPTPLFDSGVVRIDGVDRSYVCLPSAVLDFARRTLRAGEEWQQRQRPPLPFPEIAP